MTPEKIAVSSVGDPLSRSTWSGTPYHICRALEAIDRLGPVHNAESYASSPVPLLARMSARLYYLNSYESSRGLITRSLRGRGVKQFLDRQSPRPRHLLHLGSLGLPLPQKDTDTKHHLFCDASWRLWLEQSASTHRCRSRLLADSDRLERNAFSQMTSIFPISEYVKTDLIEHYDVDPGKLTVVGTGRGSLNAFHGSKDFAAGRILFVAKNRFVDKGGQLLLDGFRLVSRLNSSLHLTLVGDDDYARMTAGEANISAHGLVTDEHLQQLFNDAALFAMPALNEPWGLVYLEAMACQAPILGLNRNAIPELTANGAHGFCVREATAEAVAATLLDAFSDVDRLAVMAKAAQEFSLQNFTWEKTVQRMLVKIDMSDRALSHEHLS